MLLFRQTLINEPDSESPDFMEHHALMTFRSSAGLKRVSGLIHWTYGPEKTGHIKATLSTQCLIIKLSKYFLMMATSEKHLWPVLSKPFLLTNYCHSKCVFAYKYSHEARNSLSFLFSAFVFLFSFSFLFLSFISTLLSQAWFHSSVIQLCSYWRCKNIFSIQIFS